MSPPTPPTPQDRVHRMYVAGARNLSERRWQEVVDKAVHMVEAENVRHHDDIRAMMNGTLLRPGRARQEHVVITGDAMVVSASILLAAELELAKLRWEHGAKIDAALREVRTVVASVMRERDEARAALGRWQDDGGAT